MTVPKLEATPSGYRLEWGEEQIQIEMTRLKIKTDSASAEVIITTTKPGFSHHLHQAQLNLLSTITRSRLAKDLGERYPTLIVDWVTIIEQACVLVLREIRKGEPIQQIWTEGDYQPPEYLLHPILLQNLPTVIFSSPGAMKTEFALALICCVTLPWLGNPLGLKTKMESTTTLFLDYESYEDEIGYRLKMLKEGLHLPNFFINYRRCTSHFIEDIDNIQDKITETGARFLVMDSLGYACGGDLNKSERPIDVFLSLRKLNVTSLILAHHKKDEEGGRKTIFGSQYFEAGARSVWEIRKIQEAGDDEGLIGLFHQKVNPSGIFQPLGFGIRFNKTGTIITRQDLTETGFASTLPTGVLIKNLLRHGAVTAEDLAESLAMKKQTVYQQLQRMLKKGVVIKVGDKWGLKETM